MYNNENFETNIFHIIFCVNASVNLIFYTDDCCRLCILYKEYSMCFRAMILLV